MKYTISVDIPFGLGAEVYKKSDLRVLEDHSVSYQELVMFQVIGYESSFVNEAPATPCCGSSAEVGRVILKYKTIGGRASSFPKRFYVHPDLLVENNSEIAQKIASVAGLILPRTATS